MTVEKFTEIEKAIKDLKITFEEYMLAFNVTDEEFYERFQPDKR